MDSSIEDQFQEFHRNNPHVFDTLAHLAEGWIAAGHQHCAIGMLWEVMRWREGIRTNRRSHEFKLNNNYRSRYARMLMDRIPELRGVFEVRELRAA